MKLVRNEAGQTLKDLNRNIRNRIKLNIFNLNSKVMNNRFYCIYPVKIMELYQVPRPIMNYTP
jgi:hypothetical protein